MKKILLVLSVISFASFTNAQSGKVKALPKTKIPVLKNLYDSVSYAIGVSIANYYKQQGITKLNTTAISKGIEDILGNKTALINDDVANNVINSYLNKFQEIKSKPRIEEGAKFLEKNKLRTQVRTTASGLQYEVLKEGNGARPGNTDSVTCHYKGTFIDGTTFDNSYDRGEPITFTVGGVIAGWTEGLQLMTVGSKYKFWIPYNLAYGANDYMSIPGGSMLIFEVELLEIKTRR